MGLKELVELYKSGRRGRGYWEAKIKDFIANKQPALKICDTLPGQFKKYALMFPNLQILTRGKDTILVNKDIVDLNKEI